MNVRTIRKAVAAGAGVLLTGLLEYATTSADVERALELLVPAQLVPLVPVLLGGVATVLAVYHATNAAPASEPAGSVVEPQPVSAAVVLPPAVAAPPPEARCAPTTAGGVPSVHPDESVPPEARPEPATATSLVQLVPVPRRSYQ